MWIKDHLHTILKFCVLVLMIVITLTPLTQKALFENRFLTGIDNASISYIDAALVRAATAYALSRTFNAVVSVFEESHLQLEPAGVGVSLALGEVLDPINDLVERFSWIMLASLTALGIQKALVEIGPWFSIAIMLPLALGLMLAGTLPMGGWSQKLTYLGNAILISVIIVRFAVPLMAYLNQQVYVSVLEETHNDAIGKVTQEMGKLKNEIPDIQESQIQQPQKPTQNLWDKTKEALNRTLEQSKEMVTIQAKVNKLKETATGLIDRLVDLIVVFVLNTIVMPLLFLWAIAKLGQKISVWNKTIE